ncbi:MAG: FAD-binding oxidoreductase [Solirubrobacteraceae bacterium]
MEMSHEVAVPARFRGTILRPKDPGYDAARRIFNERLIARPAVIAQCAGVADVRAALRLACRHGLAITVRGGGHSVGGWSSIDGGLVIDLRPMRGIHVDPVTRSAWVGGGARAIDLIVEAAEHDLAPVTGVTADVGLGGLLLGLGEGYLTPRYGFGVDNVLALEVVTADERVLRVSADEHPDLFWAMRGAGANFGVVTAMHLRLHPAPQQGVGGFVTFAGDDMPRVTRHLWAVMDHGSEHYFPLARYDIDDAGRRRVAVIPGHVGPPDVAEREVGELRQCGTPVSDETAPMSYLDLIGEIGGGGARADEPDPPRRQAWDLYQFPFGGDAQRQMDLLHDQVAGLVDTSRTPYLSLWRSVAPRAPGVAPSAAPRHHGIALFIASYWRDPGDDDEQVRRVREIGAACAESGLVTEAADAINHVGTLDDARARRIYGDQAYDRLARLKALYDPDNRFRRNCNIPPAP